MAEVRGTDVPEVQPAGPASEGGNSSASVSDRALENIMKLLTSQISLAKRSKGMEGEEKRDAERRMGEIDETLEKLVTLAKKRKYISADETLASLRKQAERKMQDQATKSTINKMTQMKQRLDAQSSAVAKFLKERQDKTPEWETTEWQKLLRSNEATLVLMQRLSDKGLVTEDMLKMAALPQSPPPRRNEGQKGADPAAGSSPDLAGEIQRHPQQYGTPQSQPPATPMMHAMQGPQGQMGGGSSIGGMPGSSFMQGGMMPGMNPHMMPNGMPGMIPGMMPGMMPGMGGMMPGAAPGWGSMPTQGADMNGVQAKSMTKSSSKKDVASDSNDTEQQVRKEKKKKSRKQVIREREVEAIAQSDALKEDKLFNKNKGVGTFNNNFKVADDIRMLGAVPEEEDEREVPDDINHAHEMEMEHQRTIEEDMNRERNGIIQALMKRAAGGGGGEFSGVPVKPDGNIQSDSMANNLGGLSSMSSMNGMGPSAMQMQYMQQQNMMQMMMMQLSMRNGMGQGMGGMQPGMQQPGMQQLGMQGGMPGMPGGSMMGAGQQGMMGGMQPNMQQPGMQQGMQPGAQQGMQQPWGQPGMQPGMAPGMAPGMHPGMMNPMMQGQQPAGQGVAGMPSPQQ